MIDNVNVDVELNMNNEIIYLNITNNECFYTDNIDGYSIEYYSIDKIKRNMKLYKNNKLIRYLKDGARREFENDIIQSLKENLNEDDIRMLRFGLKKINYSVNEEQMIKRLNKEYRG